MLRTIVMSILLGSCCALALGAEPMSPAEHLKQGIFEEEANRNLDKAAEHYRAAIKGKEQAADVAGTALFRLAEITLRQGKLDEAHKLYQQLVQEYPQKKDLARLAQARLDAAKPMKEVAELKTDNAEMSAAERAFIADLEIQIQSEKNVKPEKNAPGYFGIGKNDPQSPATRAIHKAAHEGYTRAIKMLVDNGVPVDAPFSIGIKPLHSACTIGQVKSCQTLLDLGADIHAEGESGGWTAIHYASAWGRAEVIEFLVKKRAKINSQIERMTQDRVLLVPTGTPLHVASRDPNPGYTEAVKMLLSLGADINAVTSAGQTPLMTAARNGNVKVVQVLLDAGANMELQFKADPQKGQTALHDVAWFGDEKVAQLLLEKGANPNARKAEGTEGYTPLHHTAIRDCFAVAKLLVKHGADVQAKDFNGNTALHLALQKGSVASDAYLLWLLDQGLSPMQPNTQGFMPINMATGSRVELIAKHSFYPQWAKKRAVSLVRRGSYIPAGGFAAPNETATPPNLDAFLQHTIGPNYAKRHTLAAIGGVEVRLSTLNLWKLSKEGKFTTTEYKIAQGHLVIPGTVIDPPKQEPDFKTVRLNWGDIVEIDPNAYIPPLDLKQETAALVKTGQWLSEPFPDTERDNVLVRVQLQVTQDWTGGGARQKVQVAYFDAKTNAPIKTIVDGKSFPWLLEEVAGQRWLRVVMGEQPSISDMVFSYSLDGDSLSLMRLRRPGQPKDKEEPPFQTGTLRLKAANTINAENDAPPGQTQAIAWFEALYTADLDKVTAVIDVPFSLDRKSVLKTKEELLAVHKKMVESKGKRPIPKYTIAPTNDAPKLDAALFPKYEAFRVTIGDEAVDIYVTTGDNPKIIGFSD